MENEFDHRLERQFDEAMHDIYRRAKSEAGYTATRYLQMLHQHGGVEAAHMLLQSETPSFGFTALWERGRLDLTVEALFADNPEWHPLFTENELKTARNRLEECGYTTMRNDTIYIFLCSSETRAEVLRRHLVGTTWEEWHSEFSGIAPGDRVLVFDYSETAFEFIGPFEVVMRNKGKPIEPKAWSGKFPAQARIKCLSMEPQIVSLTEVAENCHVSRIMRSMSTKPRATVAGREAQWLATRFDFPVTTAKPQPSHPPKAPPKAPTVPPSPPPPRPRPEVAPPAPASSERRYKTKQGFFVASKAEKMIADLLDDWRIRCHYDGEIPNAGGYRYDFYLPDQDVYIEYWGLKGDADYDQRRAVKVRVYSDLGYRLVQIAPEDEDRLEARLRDELERKGVQIGEPVAVPAKRGFWNWLLGLLGLRR